MNISIPDSHLAHLKDAYGKIYKDYLIRRVLLDQEWQELEPMLAKLGIPVNGAKHKGSQSGLLVDTTDTEYSPTLGWLKKARYVIKAKGKALTSNEIIEFIISDFEPKLDRQTATNSMPATLSIAAKEGKINRRARGNEFEYYL